MFSFILPIGHDRSFRRPPWFTLAVIFLCTLIQIASGLDDEAMAHLADLARERMRIEARIGGYHRQRESLNAPGGTTMLQINQRVAAAIEAERKRDGSPLWDVERRIKLVVRKDLMYRLAYDTANPRVFNILTAIFAHSGWLHLIMNMIFLWLCGCNLENRWGSHVFGPIYLVGGALATLAFHAVRGAHGGALVGASGAVATAMGAFLVFYYNAKIKFWYAVLIGFKFKQGTFRAKAIYAIPFWFLQEVYWLMFEPYMTGGVAHSSHVGGFVFGAAIAALFKFKGYDAILMRRLDHDHEEAAEPAAQPEADPVTAQAMNLAALGKPAEAVTMLQRVLERTPGDAEAARNLVVLAVLAGQKEAAVPYVAEVIGALAAKGNRGELIRLYTEYENVNGVVFSERVLQLAADTAAVQGDIPLLQRAAWRLTKSFPTCPALPVLYWKLAMAMKAAGRPADAKRVLEGIVQRFPADPVARRALTELSSVPPPEA